jgi:hypothetical protein
MMRTHRQVKYDRGTARRQLAALRTTRVDARHEQVSDDLIEQHWRYVDGEDDE